MDTPLPGGRLQAQFSKNYQVQNCSPTPVVLPEQRHTQGVYILRGNEADLTGVQTEEKLVRSYSVDNTINGQTNLEVVVVEAFYLRSDVEISLTKAIKR